MYLTDNKYRNNETNVTKMDSQNNATQFRLSPIWNNGRLTFCNVSMQTCFVNLAYYSGGKSIQMSHMSKSKGTFIENDSS